MNLDEETMSETKLKPCPSGHEAHIQTVVDSCMCFVECLAPNCWWSLGERYDRDGMADHHFYSEEDAISAWNARTDPQRQRLVDALNKIIEMNRQHAQDEYGNAEKAESWSCVTVARAVLKEVAE